MQVKRLNDKQGYQITAYKNGERLTDAQAKELYKKITQHHQEWNRQLNQLQRKFDQWYAQDVGGIDALMDSPSFLMQEPVVMLGPNENQDQNKATQ